ncbi:MAG: DinB family protein, partial [Variovorax sp.]|nr:DinB family protein [Variovorax sp.]
MRRAGRDLLSLALIDARNHTLHLLSLFEEALGESMRVPQQPGVRPPVWLAGHIGWFAEWWIGRNTQRAFGIDCPVRPTRLAAIDPDADDWWNPAQGAAERSWSPDLPGLGQTKAYLLETLESTLELLENAAETDAGLYFYRLALFHEDLRGEQLVVLAQTLGLPLNIEPAPVSVTHEPLLLPSTRWELGLPEHSGFLFAREGA